MNQRPKTFYLKMSQLTHSVNKRRQTTPHHTWREIKIGIAPSRFRYWAVEAIRLLWLEVLTYEGGCSNSHKKCRLTKVKSLLINRSSIYLDNLRCFVLIEDFQTIDELLGTKFWKCVENCYLSSLLQTVWRKNPYRSPPWHLNPALRSSLSYTEHAYNLIIWI